MQIGKPDIFAGLLFRRVRFAATALAVLGLVFSCGVWVGYKKPATISRLSSRVVKKFKELRAGRGTADRQDFNWRRINTTFYDLDVMKVTVAPIGDGGAISWVGDDLLFITSAGFIGYITPSNQVEYTGLRAPTRASELFASDIFRLPRFQRDKFRVMDLLVIPRGDQEFDLYVSHHRFDGQCISLVLSRITLALHGDLVAPLFNRGWETVHEVKPCVPISRDEGRRAFMGEESGGRLVKLSDTTVLLSTGDHGHEGATQPGELYSQTPTSELGKILAIDIKSGDAEIYASGLRNPQGLTLTNAGEVLETEHGPRGGDELNLITKGLNYGWPLATLGINYDGKIWPLDSSMGRHAGFQKPVYSFLPSIGVSNLVEIRGSEFPLWQGDLLVGSLSGMTLHRLRRDGVKIIYDEQIVLGDRVRDIAQKDDGQLVVYTNDGSVLFIRNAQGSKPPRSGTFVGLSAIPRIWKDTWPESSQDKTPIGRGRIAFDRACSSCHTVLTTSGVGPTLKGVLERKVGSVHDFPYSVALQASSQRWSQALMHRYLVDPQSVFPGTAMPVTELTIEETDDVIAYLRSQE